MKSLFDLSKYSLKYYFNLLEEAFITRDVSKLPFKISNVNLTDYSLSFRVYDYYVNVKHNSINISSDDNNRVYYLSKSNKLNVLITYYTFCAPNISYNKKNNTIMNKSYRFSDDSKLTYSFNNSNNIVDVDREYNNYSFKSELFKSFKRNVLYLHSIEQLRAIGSFTEDVEKNGKIKSSCAIINHNNRLVRIDQNKKQKNVIEVVISNHENIYLKFTINANDASILNIFNNEVMFLNSLSFEKNVYELFEKFKDLMIKSLELRNESGICKNVLNNIKIEMEK